MSGHTPGPWYVVGPPWGNDTWVISGNRDPHLGRFVADCESDVDEWQETERDVLADARLIAAAPEMLTALKKVRNEVEFSNFTEARRRQILDALYEVIARAEGKP